VKRQPHTRLRCDQRTKRDYTRLPADRPDLDQLFIGVDVSNTAPPGTDATEAAWVVRYSNG